MFEILMLAAFLCAGFCHLLPEEADTEEAEPPRGEGRTATPPPRCARRKKRSADVGRQMKKPATCDRRVKTSGRRCGTAMNYGTHR